MADALPPDHPTRRFSSRVEDYARHRPGYPAAILDLLRERCGLTSTSAIADIGSGTGLLSRLFLQNGNTVYGVEPNADMRAAGERGLGSNPIFHSVDGSAEATTLPASSVNFVTAGQAFHWFDIDPARAEFRRILRPGGWVALLWNERRMDSPFMEQYEALTRRHSVDYKKEKYGWAEVDRIEAFFAPARYETACFENHQDFDLTGFVGRHKSTSYSPPPGHPAHEPMVRDLEAHFHAFESDGMVRLDYITKVYFGTLA